MASLSSRAKNAAAQRQLLKMLVFVPVALVILAAVWISAAAIIENIRFAHATDQILHLISVTHTVAQTDTNFGAQPGVDILDELAHASLISGTMGGKPATLQNPWGGFVIALTSAPSIMRIETNLPSRDCRRLALFFAKNGADLGLNLMEAHEDIAKVWRRFYDSASGLFPGNQKVEAACGEEDHVILALAMSLR